MFADVNSVAVTDPMTVKITTRVPWVAFPAFLWSTGRLGMAAPAQINDKTNCASNLIGTGPFMKKEWTPNDKFVAVRNPNYWQKDENGIQLPYLDQITFRPQPDVSQLVNGLQGGQFDLIHVTDGKAIDQLRTQVKAGTAKMVESTRSAEISHTMLNTSKPPFNNINARLAVISATNADELNRVHEANVNKLSKQPYAPETLGYQADPGWPGFDLKKAQDYVAKYKADTGQDLSFDLATTPDPATQALAATAKSQLAKAGIKVNIPTATEQSQYINQAIAGNYQAILWRNFPGGDPDTLYVWWHSKAWDKDTKAFDKPNLTNFGRINDPEIDRALEAGRSETDPAKREADYQAIGKAFAKGGYNVWTWYTTWGFASKTDVNGIEGPKLPNGDARGLPIASVQPVVGLWRG